MLMHFRHGTEAFGQASPNIGAISMWYFPLRRLGSLEATWPDMEYVLRTRGPEAIFHTHNWPDSWSEFRKLTKVVLTRNAERKVLKRSTF
jgi:hypothetical protein